MPIAPSQGFDLTIFCLTCYLFFFLKETQREKAGLTVAGQVQGEQEAGTGRRVKEDAGRWDPEVSAMFSRHQAGFCHKNFLKGTLASHGCPFLFFLCFTEKKDEVLICAIARTHPHFQVPAEWCRQTRELHTR